MLGQTLVMVTHDMSIAERADRILYMENGFDGSRQTPCTRVTHAYEKRTPPVSQRLTGGVLARRTVVHLAVDYFSNAARVCAMTSL